MPQATHTASPAAPASASAALTPRERIEACLAGGMDLPTPPAIALEVISRASDPDCDPADMAELIARDAVLCAWVLRAVNSAVYGLRNRVTTVPDAVRRLGARPLRSLALAFALSSLQCTPLPREVLQAHWRASLAGGLAARRLAQRSRRPAPDTDMVAGLVRDVGVLVLHQLFPAEYQAILATSPEILSGHQCELEEGLLTVNHAEVGAMLLRRWGLPDELTEPVRCHHDWTQASQLPGDLASRGHLLFLTSQIAQLYLTPNRAALFRQVRRLAGEMFGVGDADLGELLESIQAQITDFATALNVDVGDPGEIARVVGRGVEELARMAAASEAPRQAPPAPPALVEQTQAVRPSSGSGRVIAPASGVDGLLARLFPSGGGGGGLGELDGYLVHDVVGHGAMGAVFRATDVRLDRHVALKVMMPHCADDPDGRRRFMQEGRAIAAVTHDNVVRVFAVGEAKGIPYIAMEYVEGGSLADWLQKAPLPLAEILHIGLDTASGLAAAHARGLVHRDIKPANLLFDRAAGRVKIADFGLVQVGGGNKLSQLGRLIGTPSYVSPEQANGEPVDARSDMFSLGTVLYLACTGRLPFDSPTILGVLREIGEKTPPPIRSLKPDLPAWLEEIIEGLHGKDPARRFPSAADLRRLMLLKRAQLTVEVTRERKSGLLRNLKGLMKPA